MLRSVFGKKSLSRKRKGNVLQSMVFSVVSFGVEACMITNATASKLRGFERTCLHSILRIDPRLHLTTAKLREMAGIKTPLEDQIRERRKGFVEHIARHYDFPVTQVLAARPAGLGNFRKGRKTTFLKQIVKDLTLII